MIETRQPPARIVHLQGGLRAIDVGADQVFVQAHARQQFLHFARPEYASLYATLSSLGFHVLGVEFVSGRPFDAPDWWFSPPEGRFKLMAASRASGEMRHLAFEESRLDIVDISRRCTALLELLGIRILQLSNAYNGAYLAQAVDRALPEGNIFDNTYTVHIEAAIHAFLADAAALRDLLCEFVWIYVLGGRKEVRSFKTFRSQARGIDNPTAAAIIAAGESGWIHRLSQLRNTVFHVAPIGAHHSFPVCHVRCLTLPDGGKLSYVSYGLVDRTTVQSAAYDAIATKDEELIKEELRAYKVQLDGSEDALDTHGKHLGILSPSASGLEKLQGSEERCQASALKISSALQLAANVRYIKRNLGPEPRLEEAA